MRLFVVVLPLLAFSLACPPDTGECASDEDCPEGEVCRPLQESDENVCIVPFIPRDAGPDEPGDPVAIQDLSADDAVVAAGATTTLRWSAVNASSCAFNEGIGTVDGTGSTEVTVARTTEYTLSCQGVDGPALASVTVAVEVAVLTLTLAETQLNIGAEATASFTTIGATSCGLIAPGVDVDVPLADLESGELTFTPTSGGDVVLTCDGANGPAAESAAFEVARVASFTATPNTVSAGAQSTLSWVGESVTDCAVDDVTDADPSDSEVTVTVNESTDYTLTCTGFDAVAIQATTSVTVQ